MRIVSLEPFITDVIIHFGLAQNLVAVSASCILPPDLSALPRISKSSKSGAAPVDTLNRLLSADSVDFKTLSLLAPEAVFFRLTRKDEDGSLLKQVREALSPFLPESTKVNSYSPWSLEQVYDVLARLGKDLGCAADGLKMGQRLRAQGMDWSDNFYERMKNKKVTFLAGLEPLKLGGLWLPDMIHMASAQSQQMASGTEHKPVTQQEISSYRPDVIIVAPQGYSVEQSAQAFAMFGSEAWQDIPAVKRGEVYFTDGNEHFYKPGPKLGESFAILISAIAGLESGYITPRDSFYHLRWVELQRHRFKSGEKK